jgi:hypothetical protein
MGHPIPPSVREILADPPLLRGEDPAAYERLLGQLSAESGATGAVDWLFVKDVADLTWQIARLRRCVSAYMASREHAGLESAIYPLLADCEGSAYRTAKELAASCYEEGGGNACWKVMAQHGVPAKHVGAAYALFDNLKAIAAVERILAGLEHRRDRVIARIDAGRAAFAQALRAAARRASAAEASPAVASPSLAPAGA